MSGAIGDAWFWLRPVFIGLGALTFACVCFLALLLLAGLLWAREQFEDGAR